MSRKGRNKNRAGGLHSAQGVRSIARKHDFRTAKRLGQNFITDAGIVSRIVEVSETDERDLVVEIGPGMGVLTAELAEAAGKVVAVEVDERLLPILAATLSAYSNLTVVHADILEVDVAALIRRERKLADGTEAENVRIVGNLPYYITTPIIMKLLEERVPAASITIMVQKEVAERIVAAPGSRTYGALSVAVQYYCEAELALEVPKDVFMPVPKVDSAVLHLRVRKSPPVAVESESLFFDCVKKSFGQRRKTLHNALVGLCGMDKQQAGELLAASGIDATRRAETLSLEDFATLANRLAQPGL